MRSSILAIWSLTLIVTASGTAHAGLILPANIGTANKFDAGVFSGGTILQISGTGIIDLGGGALMYADGSLVAPYPTGSPYDYSNPGATNYSTLFGGDGINHYVGGGGNYSVDLLPSVAAFGDAGKITTDTTDPLTIRHGALIGTFADSPVREDWFLIGFGKTVVVPGASSHLWLAVHDTNNTNNLGSFEVSIESVSGVPEPASTTLLSIAAIGFVGIVRRRRRSA